MFNICKYNFRFIGHSDMQYSISVRKHTQYYLQKRFIYMRTIMRYNNTNIQKVDPPRKKNPLNFPPKSNTS